MNKSVCHDALGASSSVKHLGVGTQNYVTAYDVPNCGCLCVFIDAKVI